MLLDDDQNGPCVGMVEIGAGDGVYRGRIGPVTGRHALYLIAEHRVEGWMGQFFEGRRLFDLESLVFIK